MEYPRSHLPVYTFHVEQKPTVGSAKGKIAYKEALAQEARKHIDRPIRSHDIAIDVFYSSTVSAVADLDNILKPTLDALKGIAYLDDRQVRELRALRINPKARVDISGRHFMVEALLRVDLEHVVGIQIYSDTRLRQRSGRGAVDTRSADWNHRYLGLGRKRRARLTMASPPAGAAPSLDVRRAGRPRKP